MGEELILCDSNVFINCFKNDTPTLDALEKIGLNNIIISSISVMELINGCHDKNDLRKLKQRLKRYNVLHYNEDVSKLAQRFMCDYKLSKNLQIPDAIIGASAVVNNIRLFTYNTKDFIFMPGIKLFSHP